MKNSRCLCQNYLMKGKLGSSNAKSHDSGITLLALLRLVLACRAFVFFQAGIPLKLFRLITGLMFYRACL